MKTPFSRRDFLEASALAAGAGLTASLWQSQLLAAAAGPAPSVGGTPQIPAGPFAGSRESLNAYHVPDWFADAKFGMWNHWGPQSAAEYGDWYARRMYIQGEPQYQHHLEHYGHPSKTGFVDVIKSWKADKFDADYLDRPLSKGRGEVLRRHGLPSRQLRHVELEVSAPLERGEQRPEEGHPGAVREGGRKHGLRFGVSEHLSNSFCWFGTAHGSDKTGPLAGVPYDGIDPQYADLYHDYSQMPKDFVDKVVNAPAKGAIAMSREGPDSWRINYFNRIMDVVTPTRARSALYRRRHSLRR